MAEVRAPVFLDCSSGEPLLPEARAAWDLATSSGWGDPQRLHRPGRLAAQALDSARDRVAAHVAARPDEVVVTGPLAPTASAAVAGLAQGRRRVGALIVTSTDEHSSVLAAAAAYGQHVAVPVDRLGRVEVDAWTAAVAAPGVALACLQVANHEVGTVQPYAAAAEACRAAGVPLVLDATTALGRLDTTALGPWSVLLGWAGAYGGPGSVGFMVVRRGTRWRAPFPPDDHQEGRWPGVVDVPAVWAAVAALDAAALTRTEVADRQRGLVDRLRSGVAARVVDVDLPGDPVGNVRIGLTRTTTLAEVDAFLDVLPGIVAEIRGRLGVA